jgi:hypothetical protein
VARRRRHRRGACGRRVDGLRRRRLRHDRRAATPWPGGSGRRRRHRAAVEPHAVVHRPVRVSQLAPGPDGSLWVGGRFPGFPSAAQSGIARFAPAGP